MKILKNLAIGLGTLGLMMSVTSCRNTDTPASDSTYSESDHSHNHDHSNSDSSGSTSESGSSTTGGSSSTTTPTTPTVHTHTWGGVRYEFASVNGNYSITARRNCTTCDEHEEEAVSAVKNVIKEPTCTETGSAVVVSDDFTNSSFTVQTKTVTLEALGHNKVHHEEVDATCDNDGHSEYDECLRCGEITGYTKYEKLGHDYQISYTWSDDLTTVTATRVCLNDETDVVSEVGRAVVQTIKQATCQETGLVTSTASFTNSFFETQRRENAVVPKTEHNLKIISGYDNTCTEDGLTDKIYCLDCGEVIQEALKTTPKGHKYDYVGRVEPTCQTEGSTGVLQCVVCGDVLEETQVLEKVDHSYVWKGKSTATCKEDGYAIVECEYCGLEKINEDQVVKAIDVAHTPEIVPAVEPTSCLFEGVGYTEWTRCSVCGMELSSKTLIPGDHKYEPDGFECIYCGKTRYINDNGEYNPETYQLKNYKYAFFDTNGTSLMPYKINGIENTFTTRTVAGKEQYVSTLSADYSKISISIENLLGEFQIFENTNGMTKLSRAHKFSIEKYNSRTDTTTVYGLFQNLDTSIGTNYSTLNNGELAKVKFYLKNGETVEKTLVADTDCYLNFALTDIIKIDATFACLNYGSTSNLNEWIDVEYKDVKFIVNNEHLEGDLHNVGTGEGFGTESNIIIIKNNDYLNYSNTIHYMNVEYNDNIQQEIPTTDYYISEDTFTITEEEIQSGTIKFDYITNTHQDKIEIPSDLTAGTYKIKIEYVWKVESDPGLEETYYFVNGDFAISFIPVTE